MNKKQEALRRGLRSFIADTLQEFEALQGHPVAHDADTAVREAGAEPPNDLIAGRGAGEPAVVEPTSGAAEAPTGVSVEPSADRELAAPRIIVPGWTVVSETLRPLVLPDTPRDEDELRQRPESLQIDENPGRPDPAPQASAVGGNHRPLGASTAAAEAAPLPDAPGVPRRRTRAAARRRRTARRRAAPDPGANGAGREQAYGRKGVCFAYFTNPQCWRVPDAYCNTALQVCITRECPVYQLHKELLERRFAKKFKHFW